MASVPHLHLPRPANYAPSANFDLEAATRAIAAGGLALLAEDAAEDARLMLVAAARGIAGAVVNRMATDGRGLICLAVSAEQAARLGLHPMVEHATNPRCANFACSIEARWCVTTGISAADRARTMSLAAARATTPADLVTPGHVFPVVAHAAGVLGRQALPEAAVDLVARAGAGPAAAYCQILRDDGEVATVADLPRLRWAQAVPATTLDALVADRRAGPRLVHG
jgi:3,4-dihydroxy 2-butanone 4-phosphate synthase/GTP cyclohydrolase II